MGISSGVKPGSAVSLSDADYPRRQRRWRDLRNGWRRGNDRSRGRAPRARRRIRRSWRCRWKFGPRRWFGSARSGRRILGDWNRRVSGTGGTSSQAGAGGTGAGGAGGSSGGSGGNRSGLGVACSARTDCQSGFCVDGVCCDSACDGVCEQCSSAGVCTMPATDSACAPVSCPQSTACKTYTSSTLSTNLCKSQGECKTPSDCPSQYTAVRTPCGGTAPDQMLCDGAGSCKQPTVLCGAAASCPTMPGSCEIVGQGGTQALPAVSISCTTSDSGCGSANAYCVNITCDGSSDCPTGTVCCWVSGGGQSSTCTAATNCTSGPYTTASIMCEPTLGNADCPSGLTCSGDFGGTAIFGGSGSSYHYCR